MSGACLFYAAEVRRLIKSSEKKKRYYVQMEFHWLIFKVLFNTEYQIASNDNQASCHYRLS